MVAAPPPLPVSVMTADNPSSPSACEDKRTKKEEEESLCKRLAERLQFNTDDEIDDGDSDGSNEHEKPASTQPQPRGLMTVTRAFALLRQFHEEKTLPTSATDASAVASSQQSSCETDAQPALDKAQLVRHASGEDVQERGRR